MKPTPGPWGLRGSQIRADGGRGQHIATYMTNVADGKLMAAAPLLYEACKEAAEMIPPCGLTTRLIRALEAAEPTAAELAMAGRDEP